MNKTFIILSFLMGVIVLSSNYLVQFPINHYGLNEILTYGAFTYPIAFLITDLANRSYGKLIAQKNCLFRFFYWGGVHHFIFYKLSRFNLNQNCFWFRNCFFCSSVVRCSNFWSIEKKEVVYSTFNVFNYCLCRWYLFIFLNFFLCNRSAMGDLIFWRLVS